MMNEFDHATQSILRDDSFLIVALGTGFALVLLLALKASLQRRRKAISLFSSETGHIRVSPKALRELVTISCRNIGTTRPHVYFYTKAAKLHLHVRLKMRSEQKLAETFSKLQEHLKQTLRENLGVEKLGSIDITVTGFKILHPEKNVLDVFPEESQ